MTRHLYFRDNGHKFRSGISYNIPDLILGIESSVRFPIIDKRLLPAMTHESLFTERSNLYKPGIFLYFYPPSLVISQVPVQGVHFIKGYHVDISLYIFGREEMTAHVKMHSPVGKPWSIFYFACRNGKPESFDHKRFLYISRHKLPDCLNRVKEPRSRFCFYDYFFRSDR